jgi:uncharacterized protein YkuJ
MRLQKLSNDGGNNEPKRDVVRNKYVMFEVLCFSNHVIVTLGEKCARGKANSVPDVVCNAAVKV